MTNPLRDLKLGDGSGGSFIKFKSGEPVKLRVLSTDPVVNVDQYGNTRFSFPVWSYNDNQPMILSKGASIVRAIQNIDADEDFGANVTKVDLKITASGEGMETRYTINALPNAVELSTEQIEAVEELDAKLEKVIKNGVRASAYNTGTTLPKSEDSFSDEDVPPEFR